MWELQVRVWDPVVRASVWRTLGAGPGHGACWPSQEEAQQVLHRYENFIYPGFLRVVRSTPAGATTQER